MDHIWIAVDRPKKLKGETMKSMWEESKKDKIDSMKEIFNDNLAPLGTKQMLKKGILHDEDNE